MSNTKFTPGPWDSNITASGYLCVFKKWPSKEYPDAKNVFEMQTIGVIRPFKDLTEYDMPNANLMASAPELLENLIRLVDRIKENELQNHFPSAFERAVEVIKKATN